MKSVRHVDTNRCSGDCRCSPTNHSTCGSMRVYYVVLVCAYNADKLCKSHQVQRMYRRSAKWNLKQPIAVSSHFVLKLGKSACDIHTTASRAASIHMREKVAQRSVEGSDHQHSRCAVRVSTIVIHSMLKLLTRRIRNQLRDVES